MYHIAMYLAQVGIAIAALFDHKIRVMWRGQRAAFKTLKEKVDPSSSYIWVHAASLGEFEQGRPIIERIKLEHPQYKILLTFFSPSGYRVRYNYDGADIVTYLPLDTPTNARRFLRIIRPKLVFFIKYEFWYNYLNILKHQDIPTYSVSSIFRPNQIFFRWYGRGYARVLKCFTRFFVQNEESRALLAKAGIHNVDVVGDTRFDRVMTVKKIAKPLPVIEAFVNGEKPSNIFVAGSSWPPDEDIFLKYFNEHRSWKLIIAPHVISEDHLVQIMSKYNGRSVRFTQTSAEDATKADALIIDCFGLLSSIYHYGNLAYVGGGFGVGIHNTLEAAVWNMPVIFGPNNKKFREAQALKSCGGGFEIEDYNGFQTLMNHFEANSTDLKEAGLKAGKLVESLSGATEKIMQSIFHSNHINETPQQVGL